MTIEIRLFNASTITVASPFAAKGLLDAHLPNKRWDPVCKVYRAALADLPLLLDALPALCSVDYAALCAYDESRLAFAHTLNRVGVRLTERRKRLVALNLRSEFGLFADIIKERQDELRYAVECGVLELHADAPPPLPATTQKTGLFGAESVEEGNHAETTANGPTASEFGSRRNVGLSLLSERDVRIIEAVRKGAENAAKNAERKAGYAAQRRAARYQQKSLLEVDREDE